jgi:hypothetical protein
MRMLTDKRYEPLLQFDNTEATASEPR